MLPAALLVAALLPAYGTEYFVSPAGADSAAGKDIHQPLLTIQHAVDLTKPGDSVTVLDGVYKEGVLVNHSGAQGAPIVIRSLHHWGAKMITPEAAKPNSFKVGDENSIGVAYITICGFDCMAPGKWASAVFSSYKAHHITVEDLYAHNCGSGGICLNDGDYRIVRNCVAAYNAWLMPYCGSGISFYGMIKADDKPGIHNLVIGNVSYGNDNGPGTSKTDADGIIIDDFRDTQDSHTSKPATQNDYTGAATLVKGNLVFHNGGKGIITYLGNNITIENNTCVRDLRRENQGDEGELCVSNCSHVVVRNNISVISTGPEDPANHPAVVAVEILSNKDGGGHMEDVALDHNLSYDEHKPGDPSFKAKGFRCTFGADKGNLAGIDPQLAMPDDAALFGKEVPGTMEFKKYFELRAGSPAIGAGIAEGTGASAGGKVDLGAFPSMPATRAGGSR